MTSIRVGYLIGNPIQLKLQDDNEVDDSQAQKFQMYWTLLSLIRMQTMSTSN
ncbi:hypothetical protein [Lactiplantibacillus argentoratensis]|uniref:hypothetical protein n=1 Tax=Lactiplantibacillus argentoratensis TaxID=271881 RepID=UPI0021CB96AB|nr:hypothetical protein [Lactiplantibacillus argentoratensis]